MAFRMRRFRTRRRSKRRYAWLGIEFARTFELDEAVGTVAFEIVGPASSPELGTNVDCVLQRVILHWNVINTQLLITSAMTMYLAVLETNNNLLPLAYIPDTFDADYMAKRDTMWMTHFFLNAADEPAAWVGTMPPAGAAAVGQQGLLLNNGMPLDIGVKRRVRGGEGLYLVVRNFAVPGGEIGALAEFSGWARCLYSFGRK